jgi:Tfp pilus assembly protein PilO
MNRNLLRRIVWLRVQQVGAVGLAGLALLMVAVVTWFAVVQADQRELVKLTRTLDALRAQEAQKNNLPAHSALGKEEQVEIFYRTFPTEDQLPDALAQLYRAAEKHELVLETGEYARTRTGAERLIRYRVMLPVKGTFKQVLAFMDGALKDTNMALENATFKRDKVDDVQVEAKLSFILFVNAKP